MVQIIGRTILYTVMVNVTLLCADSTKSSLQGCGELYVQCVVHDGWDQPGPARSACCCSLSGWAAGSAATHTAYRRYQWLTAVCALVVDTRAQALLPLAPNHNVGFQTIPKSGLK